MIADTLPSREVCAVKPTRERFTYLGRFVIRTEWHGRILLYDVLAKNSMLVACGFDALRPDEDTTIAGIAERLLGKQRDAA